MEAAARRGKVRGCGILKGWARDGGDHRCCRFSCRLNPTLSGIARGEQRQITLSVNDLQNFLPNFLLLVGRLTGVRSVSLLLHCARGE